MKSIKNKLSSKSGASMLLALVFLLFCLMVGGSVLSAATANGSRAAQKKVDQQAYLSQRSASLLLADMLKSTEDSAMQLTIKDVVSDSGRTITFMAHGTEEKSDLQMLLYELAIGSYLTPLAGETYAASYVNLGSYSFTTAPSETGTISIALAADGVTDTLYAKYFLNDEGDFCIDYAVTPLAVGGEAKPPQQSYVTLTMKWYTAPGDPVTVNGVTTKTTVVRWADPVIAKEGAE